jgi:hypothetical protein
MNGVSLINFNQIQQAIKNKKNNNNGKLACSQADKSN